MLQRYYSELGIEYPPIKDLELLINQVLGKNILFKPYMFVISYANSKHCPIQILDRDDSWHYIINIIEKNSDIIDPEDLVQEIMINIMVDGINGLTGNMLKLRDYVLYKEHMFKRYILSTEEWKEEYLEYLKEMDVPPQAEVITTSLRYLLEDKTDVDFCIFDRYLLYLKYSIGLADIQIASVLQMSLLHLSKATGLLDKRLKRLLNETKQSK